MFNAVQASGKTPGDWIADRLRAKGLNPFDYKSKGEEPEEMIHRYAKARKMTIDGFYRWLLK